MAWRAPLVAVVLGVVAVSSCGPSENRPASLGDFGRCDADHVDGPPLEHLLGEPTAWLRVSDIDVAATRAGELPVREAVRGRYTVVGGDSAVRAELGQPDTLRFLDHMAYEVEQALRVGEVYVTTGGRRGADSVRLAVVFTDRDFAFLGWCEERARTAPLKQRLGEKAYATVRGWVGRTGAEMAATFPKPSPRPSSTETILNPETAPEELLASLRIVTFTLAPVPDSWLGPYTVCTRIRQGWSDCVDLTQRATADLMVDAYVDPENPTIEVWLLDQSATLSRPVARLGSIDVGAAVTKAGLRLDDGPRLVATLDASSSPEAAAADSARAARSIAKVAARRHTP